MGHIPFWFVGKITNLGGGGGSSVLLKKRKKHRVPMDSNPGPFHHTNLKTFGHSSYQDAGRVGFFKFLYLTWLYVIIFIFFLEPGVARAPPPPHTSSAPTHMCIWIHMGMSIDKHAQMHMNLYLHIVRDWEGIHIPPEKQNYPQYILDGILTCHTESKINL